MIRYFAFSAFISRPTSLLASQEGFCVLFYGMYTIAMEQSPSW